MKFLMALFLMIASASAQMGVGGSVSEATGSKARPPRYLVETCRWAKDMPREITTLPALKECKEKARVCSGYVICDSVREDGPRVARLSTCDPENCGEDKAVECTKQTGFQSVKAQGVTSEVPESVKAEAEKFTLEQL